MHLVIPCTKGSKSGPANERFFIAFVERGCTLRTFKVARADKKTVTKIVTDNIAEESCLNTKESRVYFGPDRYFAAHEAVRYPRGEYVCGDMHTNSADFRFSNAI
jgi:hypothetical protein